MHFENERSNFHADYYSFDGSLYFATDLLHLVIAERISYLNLGFKDEIYLHEFDHYGFVEI